MTIDPQEAKQSLEAIQQAQTAEKSVGGREVGWLLIIWGLVWLIGFLLSQYGPAAWLLWVWLLLLLAGSAASAVVGIKLGRQVQYVDTGPKLGLLYPALIGFSLLWLYLAQPASWQQTAVLAVSFVGFAAVVNGILIKARALIAIGLVATVLAVAVYLFLQPYFGLIVGLVGGGGMVLAGLRLHRAGSARG